jgi:tetratricopeptide (TPR) repeat protein
LVPAAGASAVAFVTQEVAMPTLDELPVGTRVGTALIATGAYLGKTLWPVNLAAFYPLDLDVSVPRAVVSGVLLSVLSAGALLAWRSRPWLTVGWAWYLLMLAPVVGLVQIGSQSMADRYTYLPGIGLSIAAAWGVAEWTRSRPRVRQLLAGVVAAWLGVCLLLARGQVFTWRDSVALFEHSQSVTGGNVIAALNLGEAHEDAGDVERAVVQYRRALEWKPGALGANARLGALLARRGDVERAMRHLLLAVRLEPLDPEAHTELGALLLRRGAAGEAAAELERALELDPDQARAAFHLAEVRAAVGEADEAEQLFARALSARPPIEDEPLVDKHPLVLAALSRGCAAAGRPERALHWNARALVIAQLSGQAELAAQLREDAARYRASAP